MMETKIYGFHTSFYIPAMQRLDFHLTHVRILDTNHCGQLQHTAFKCRELFQDVLCNCDYAERVVASFAHQIQSGCCGGNISVPIEGIALGHFSALPKSDINSTTPSHQRYAVFHYFYLMITSKIMPLILHKESFDYTA